MIKTCFIISKVTTILPDYFFLETQIFQISLSRQKKIKKLSIYVRFQYTLDSYFKYLA